jgi:hypothetical protein
MAATSPRIGISQGEDLTHGVADQRRIAGWSLLAAYAGGEACSIYAVFIAHSLQPVTFYLPEQNPLRRAVSGKYVEVFNPDGLMATLLVSLIVFVAIWCLLEGVARNAFQRPAARDRAGAASRLRVTHRGC